MALLLTLQHVHLIFMGMPRFLARHLSSNQCCELTLSQSSSMQLLRRVCYVVWTDTTLVNRLQLHDDMQSIVSPNPAVTQLRSIAP